MPTINVQSKEMQNGDVVLSYSNTVGPQSETYTFQTPQETVILFNKGSKGITYNLGGQSGTLFPSQSVKVTGSIESFSLSSQGGTQHFEIWAEEAGTKGISDQAVAGLDAKVTALQSSVAQKSNITNKRIVVENTTADTLGGFDIANYAGQGTPDIRDIMSKIHNYTDSDVMWLDNVGEGNVILRINNANNAIRRADKPSNYVGSGKFIQLGTKNVGTGVYVIELEIDADANIMWGGSRNESAILRNDKTNATDVPAFILRTPSGRQDKVLQIQTKATNDEVVSFGVHPSGTTAEMDIGSGMTYGLNIAFSAVNANSHLKYGTAGSPRTVPNVRTAANPPGVNAEFIGQQYIDTANRVVYVATATGTGASDWTQISN